MLFASYSWLIPPSQGLATLCELIMSPKNYDLVDLIRLHMCASCALPERRTGSNNAISEAEVGRDLYT